LTDRLNIFGIILLLLSSELMSVLVRDLLSHLFSQLLKSLLFFIYWKKEQKIFLFPFQFLFYHLLTMVFLFFRKNFLKNQMQIFFCGYSIISSLLKLVIKHDKSEIFHFSRAMKNFNSPSLDLRPSGGAVLRQKDTWQY